MPDPRPDPGWNDAEHFSDSLECGFHDLEGPEDTTVRPAPPWLRKILEERYGRTPPPPEPTPGPPAPESR
jgi:hypothetical protein